MSVSTGWPWTRPEGHVRMDQMPEPLADQIVNKEINL